MSNEIRIITKHREIKHSHEKGMKDGTGFEVDSLSIKWIDIESSSSDSLHKHREALCF